MRNFLSVLLLLIPIILCAQTFEEYIMPSDYRLDSKVLKVVENDNGFRAYLLVVREAEFKPAKKKYNSIEI